MLRSEAPSSSEREEKSEGNSVAAAATGSGEAGAAAAAAAAGAGVGAAPVDAKRACRVEESRKAWEETTPAAPILPPERVPTGDVRGKGVPLRLRPVPNCLVPAAGLACRGTDRAGALETICASSLVSSLSFAVWPLLRIAHVRADVPGSGTQGRG